MNFNLSSDTVTADCHCPLNACFLIYKNNIPISSVGRLNKLTVVKGLVGDTPDSLGQQCSFRTRLACTTTTPGLTVQKGKKPSSARFAHSALARSALELPDP